MKPRHKKLAIIASSVTALGVASILVLNAFQSNLVFFFSPTQVANKEAPAGQELPDRRPGGRRQRQAPDRWRHGKFRCDRYRKSHPGCIYGHPSRPVQGRQRRRGAGQARRMTAFSAPTRCLPNTTRIICRRKRPTPWIKRIRRAKPCWCNNVILPAWSVRRTSSIPEPP